jgi:hypothetical protein
VENAAASSAASDTTTTFPSDGDPAAATIGWEVLGHPDKASHTSRANVGLA